MLSWMEHCILPLQRNAMMSLRIRINFGSGEVVCPVLFHRSEEAMPMLTVSTANDAAGGLVFDSCHSYKIWTTSIKIQIVCASFLFLSLTSYCFIPDQLAGTKTVSETSDGGPSYEKVATPFLR